MTKKILVCCLILSGRVVPAAAQSPFDQRAAEALRSADHAQAADRISTAMVAGQLTIETLLAARTADPRRALLREGIAVGLTVGIAEITKRAVRRTRPDGSDRRSFFSEHTALAFTPVGLGDAGGWAYSVQVPVAVSAGGLRMTANKHWATDVLTGAGVGWIAGRVSRRLVH